MNLNRKQYFVCFSICALIFTTGLLIALSITLPDFLLPRDVVTTDRSIVTRLQTGSTFKIILFNNSKVFFILTIGILTCGIFSVVQSFVIGAVVGAAVRLSLDSGGSYALVTAALLPHGIFELTAFMVVSALGLYFGLRVHRYTQGLADDWTSFKITEQSLGKLRSEELPDDVLQKLESITDRLILGEKRFSTILSETLGDEQTVAYKRKILKRAIDWINEIKTYGIISLGAYMMLFLAAVIETFLTPSIAVNFL